MTILSIFVCLLSVLSCGSDNEETEVAIIDVSPAQLSATHEGLVTSATITRDWSGPLSATTPAKIGSVAR